MPPATITVAAPRFTMARVRQYGAVTGDMNPLHVDPEFAATTRFGAPIVHGLFVLVPVWEAIEQTFGRAAVAGAQADIRFAAPIFVGTTPAYRVALDRIDADGLHYAVEIVDEAGKVAVTTTITIVGTLR